MNPFTFGKCKTCSIEAGVVESIFRYHVPLQDTSSKPSFCLKYGDVWI